MQPTKEQWERIAEQLDRFFSPVYLRCDGYIVGARMMRTGKNRLGICVDVNGWQFKGEWMPSLSSDDPREMSDEARRFWRPVKRTKMKHKELKAYERFYGKRECRRRGYYDPWIWPEPVWLRPRPFIAHLKKHNERIEVIDYDTYTRELEAVRTKETVNA